MVEKEAEEEVRKFLLSLSSAGSTSSYWKYVSDKPSEGRGQACHAYLYEGKKPLALGSGFLPTKGQLPVAMRLWEWVTDKDKSPWRILMQNGIELVISEKSELPVGWILPKETLENTPFTFQKNFCILTRVLTEKYDNFKFWNTLVEKGVREDDALYLASCLIQSKQGRISTLVQLGGGHWPLTDSRGYSNEAMKDSCQFDWKAFRSGNINPSRGHGPYAVINGHFCQNERTDYMMFDPGTIPYKNSGGRFSQIKEYDLDTILDEFYKWQDNEGVLA